MLVIDLDAKFCNIKRQGRELRNRLDVFDLDPVDLNYAAANTYRAAEPIRDGFIYKTEPPTHTVFVAQDRSARTGLDSAVVEPGGVGTG